MDRQLQQRKDQRNYQMGSSKLVEWNLAFLKMMEFEHLLSMAAIADRRFEPLNHHGFHIYDTGTPILLPKGVPVRDNRRMDRQLQQRKGQRNYQMGSTN